MVEILDLKSHVLWLHWVFISFKPKKTALLCVEIGRAPTDTLPVKWLLHTPTVLFCINFVFCIAYCLVLQIPQDSTWRFIKNLLVPVCTNANSFKPFNNPKGGTAICSTYIKTPFILLYSWCTINSARKVCSRVKRVLHTHEIHAEK